ncbi:MAG: hypothetical protein QMD12_03450 [Candidatus Aenigmarchaeota archaeon]|nr:hypothetical protein [Candidatus Aenigmarchaeota archaeon]
MIAIEDFLGNCLKLRSKWYGIKKDRYYLKDYLSKRPEEMEKHIKEIDEFEQEILESPLHESDKKKFLDSIRSYKCDLDLYQVTSNPSQGYALELLFFTTFLCLGGLLTHLAGEYYQKSKIASERGLREGFVEKLNEVLKRHGVSV